MYNQSVNEVINHMYNALIVNDSGIQKIFVDFSRLDNIYDVLKVDRLSTIHTRETQRISSILGVHLMGFVDRDCSGPNNKKACEISGYDYLGADLLLCKTDDKFNPLPLEENELERVYKYLLTGEIVVENTYLLEFYERNGINPDIPIFPVDPKPTFYEQYPTVAILKYDISELSDSELERFGTVLFHLSSVLVEKYTEAGECRLSPDGSHYIQTYMDRDNHAFYIYIQAIIDDSREPLVGSLSEFVHGKGTGNPYEKSVSGGEKHVRVEDAIEEEIDNDIEFEFTPIDEVKEERLIGYFLMMDFDAKWVDSRDDYSYKCKNCMPLDCYLDEEIRPYVIHFKDFIEIMAVDLDNEAVRVKVNGNINREYELELNKSVTIDFDYLGKPKDRSTHRVGKVTLTFEYIEIESDSIKSGDKIELDYIQYSRGKEDYRTIESLKVDNSLENKEMVSLPDGVKYGLYAVSEDRDRYILYAFESDGNEEDGMLFIPLSRKDGVTIIFEEEYKDGLKRTKRITKLYYDEYETNYDSFDKYTN